MRRILLTDEQFHLLQKILDLDEVDDIVADGDDDMIQREPVDQLRETVAGAEQFT